MFLVCRRSDNIHSSHLFVTETEEKAITAVAKATAEVAEYMAMKMDDPAAELIPASGITNLKYYAQTLTDYINKAESIFTVDDYLRICCIFVVNDIENYQYFYEKVEVV